MQDHAQNNNKNCFFLNCIDTRKIFYKAHIKLHIDYASVVGGGGGGGALAKYTLKKNELSTLKGR